MRKKKALPLALAAVAALSIAAASVSYLCWPVVLDQGGGVASSSSYQMRGSVGGPVIAGAAVPGIASSANYRLDVNSVTVLESAAKEEPPPDGNGGGGGCCGSGAAALAFALMAGSRRRRS